jgi:4-amino-4-deoxy-L-arabinose transferase-like glycosyltransferase
LITPPFQVPDEVDHYAYVQQLAVTGHLPSSSEEEIYSSQEQRALRDLRYYQVREAPEAHTISSRAQQRKLELDLALPLSQQNNRGAAGVAASEPPLYYALETIPYRLGGGNLLDRLELMRLLSAMMAGVTALFVFLFLREALPRAPRTWLIGSLGVALAPLLGFISGGLNPDAMLAAVSAALFYLLARGFRGGLSPKLAVAIGCTIAVGFLTKLNFIGLAPGAILGLGLLTVREARTHKRLAIRSCAIALAIAASPVLLYVLHNLVVSRPMLGEVSDAAGVERGSALHAVSYIWQFYLPRLPGMHSYFPSISTTRQIWFDRLVGLYGWLDTAFPGWVYEIALIPTGLSALLCVKTLAGSRIALRHRAPELLVYAAMFAGVLVLIGADSYINSFKPIGELYAEPRYLLPMAALAGAVLALATRGAGRRWAPAVGALIVTAILAHDIFSQLLVISRYYG